MEKINNKIFNVKKLVTENKDLYGSIKPTEISKLIYENEKIEIKPSLIQPLKEIKSLGTFKVKIDLHSDVQAEIKIKVELKIRLNKLYIFFPRLIKIYKFFFLIYLKMYV